MIWLTQECFQCVHWRKGTDPPECAAFDGEIPVDILTGEVSHTEPIEGDHGLRFEAKPA